MREPGESGSFSRRQVCDRLVVIIILIIIIIVIIIIIIIIIVVITLLLLLFLLLSIIATGEDGHGANRWSFREGPRARRGMDFFGGFIFPPEGIKRATSVNVHLPRLRKDQRTSSILRDIVHFRSALCRHRSGIDGSSMCGAPGFIFRGGLIFPVVEDIQGRVRMRLASVQPRARLEQSGSKCKFCGCGCVGLVARASEAASPRPADLERAKWHGQHSGLG